ncbi:MAG TPA: HAD family phosphatase [Anaerolineae bacterium]|nr:HAD family phosphatase [Anaerolineae bacterium]
MNNDQSTLIKGILFDLDGLMFDSEPHSLASWEAVLEERGVVLDQLTIDSILGLRIDATARTLIDKYHLSDTVQGLADAKTEYQITHLEGKVKPMPGLIELLDEIDRRRMPKAIASSGIRRYVEAVLRVNGLLDRFSVIITGDQVAHGKPAPDVFLAAARALNVEPQYCLVLEDAPTGVQAARTAGMMCIAVPDHSVAQLDLSQADHVVTSLHDVRTFLASN